MTAAYAEAGPMMPTIFTFDWEEVGGRRLAAVFGLGERRGSTGDWSWESLALVLEDGRAILLNVTQDTDEILLSLAPARPEGEGWAPASAFTDQLGRELGWSWEGRNYRGYLDMFLIALGEVVPDALNPRLLFVAAGSTLTCRTIGRPA